MTRRSTEAVRCPRDQAIHEAGHAVARLCLGHSVSGAPIFRADPHPWVLNSAKGRSSWQADAEMEMEGTRNPRVHA
jgi:hypothetical protein